MEQESLSLVAEGLDRILAQMPSQSVDQTKQASEQMDVLWAALVENGFPLLCASEAHGGVGGSLADLPTIAETFARHAASVPLVDTALAVGLLSCAGIEAPHTRIGLADPVNSSAAIPYAAQLDAVVVLEGGVLRCVPVQSSDIVSLPGLEDGAGRLAASSHEPLLEIAAPDWMIPLVIRALGALMRSAMMAGAMQTVLETTLRFTEEREQFGRPLSRFQAIQHHLADIAGEVAASQAAIQMAADALRSDRECGATVIEDIAIAKVRCGQAASKVAAAAHQAHGAMGFTWEYTLGRYTRRLWQWQDEFGTETEWASYLGRAVLESEQPSLWRHISRST